MQNNKTSDHRKYIDKNMSLIGNDNMRDLVSAISASSLMMC